MIAATVHDPHLIRSFCSGDDPIRRALIREHISHVAHAHLIVIDRERPGENSILGVQTRKAIESLPPGLRQRMEAAIAPHRIIRLPFDAERRNSIVELLGRDETAIAISFQGKGLDAVITDDEGKAGFEVISENPGTDLMTLAEYCDSSCHQRLAETMGGYSTRDITTSEFNRVIVGPVLRWAKGVMLIDRHIGSAYYDKKTGDDNIDNQWARVCATLRFLYQTWEATIDPDERRYEFSVITQMYDRKKWEQQPSRYGPYPDKMDQAKNIASGLKLGKYAKVKIIRVPSSLRSINHDRFLCTDRDVVLSFSRGFDLLRPSDNRLCESTISLNRQETCQTIQELLNQSITLAESRCGADGI